MTLKKSVCVRERHTQKEMRYHLGYYCTDIYLGQLEMSFILYYLLMSDSREVSQVSDVAAP